LLCCVAVVLRVKLWAMIKWQTATDLVAYEDALQTMDQRVADIREGSADELIWFLEHPPLYTAGTRARADDLLDARFPVYQAGRGGEYPYHGPGPRVAYLMMDLKARQSRPDVKAYVCHLEKWIIRTLATFDIHGECRDGRIGVWVDTEQGEKKIAALGIRIRRWVTLHGISINVSPDLSHFGGIVPCGISDYGVTSMVDLLGRDVSMEEVDGALKAAWEGF